LCRHCYWRDKAIFTIFESDDIFVKFRSKTAIFFKKKLIFGASMGLGLRPAVRGMAVVEASMAISPGRPQRAQQGRPTMQGFVLMLKVSF
jgi:hypothetical protein